MKKLIFLLLFPVLSFGQDNVLPAEQCKPIHGESLYGKTLFIPNDTGYSNVRFTYTQTNFKLRDTSLFKDTANLFTVKAVGKIVYPNGLSFTTYSLDDSLNYKGIVISEVQQGTIEEHPQDNFFSGKLDYSIYRSPSNSTHWLIFLVGKGEVGDCAGGNIQALYKYGFPKLVKAGSDFDFNILMVQPCGTNYPAAFQKSLLSWVTEEFHPSKIILSGISLGAICTLDMLTVDEYKHIAGVVSLSGAPSASKGIDEALSRMRFVPGYAYHGTQDTTVPYSKAIKFFNAYNTLNAGTDNVFTLDIQNTGHNGWDSVMSYNGALHQWIIKQFGSEPQGETFEDGKEYIKKGISEALDKL